MMILSQEFDGRALLTQIPELAEIAGTTDELLSLLDAAAEASASKALLIIDAINESERPERWSDTVRALQTKTARFPRAGLVLSCRTGFIDAVVESTDMPVAEHYGFEEATDVAVRRFAAVYRLDVPTLPVSNPEFANPLFLRLTCEALTTLGTRFSAAIKVHDMSAFSLFPWVNEWRPKRSHTIEEPAVASSTLDADVSAVLSQFESASHERCPVVDRLRRVVSSFLAVQREHRQVLLLSGREDAP